MTDEERLSLKLARQANKCNKCTLGHMILATCSNVVYDIGKFNHSMAHAFGYSGTGFVLGEAVRDDV